MFEVAGSLSRKSHVSVPEKKINAHMCLEMALQNRKETIVAPGPRPRPKKHIG